MAAGGIFRILTNDGKMDQMLMATRLLKDRICDIIDARTAAGMDEQLPTIRDLEKTHILHFQSKFKPFVAVGFEYQKIKPQSGTSSLSGSSSVTFSIPQFGDFLSDATFRIDLTSTYYAAATLPASLPSADVGPTDAGTSSAVTNTVFLLPDGITTLNTLENVTVDGVQRGVVRRLRSVAAPITAAGTSTTTATMQSGVRVAAALAGPTTAYSPYFDPTGRVITQTTTAGTALSLPSVADRAYYCDFPGERILKKVSFDVNGNPLDYYDTYSYVWYRKFRLRADKKVGYFRNMGQELPKVGYTDLLDDGLRKSQSVYSGPQTPQLVQPLLRVWPKLLFWNNLDHANSIASAAIPFGQRFITCELANSTDLVFRAPAAYNIKVLTTDIYSLALSGTTTFDLTDATTGGARPVGGNTTAAGQANVLLSSKAQLLLYPVFTNGSLTAPTIGTFELYYNNIFTIPEVHDIYIERIGFTLIRVHRIQSSHVAVSSYELLMSQFKYPIEFIYAGLLPDINVSQSFIPLAPTVSSTTTIQMGAPPDATDWHRFSYISRPLMLASSCKSGSLSGAGSTYAVALNASSESVYVPTVARTVDTLSVTIHGIYLYNAMDADLFNRYFPDTYAQDSLQIVTPDDEGALFINFALTPGSNQPSGHINSSRAREFYISYVSSIIGSTPTSGPYSSTTLSGTLMCEATALNFLLVSDGSAVLRYTT